MWIADNWKDYEVIDCSKGEKLERWGDYILVRPDPQVIWDTPKTDKGWKSRNGHYHRSKKGGGEWEFFSLPEQWQIHYGSLTFNLKPFNLVAVAVILSPTVSPKNSLATVNSNLYIHPHCRIFPRFVYNNTNCKATRKTSQ